MKQSFFALSTSWRRASLLVAAAATALVSSLAMIPTSASAAGLDGTWSCTIPSKHVWSAIRSDSSCPDGLSKLLALPAEGKWVCKLPTPWTYDTLERETTHGPCQLGASRGTSYHLITPRAGRIACELPKNNIWTYNGVSTNTNTTACRLGGGATGIVLVTPATNVWGCVVPTGFTYTQSQLNTGGNPNPCLGMFIYLLKKL
jgi:hypothetical protein